MNQNVLHYRSCLHGGIPDDDHSHYSPVTQKEKTNNQHFETIKTYTSGWEGGLLTFIGAGFVEQEQGTCGSNKTQPLKHFLGGRRDLKRKSKQT